VLELEPSPFGVVVEADHEDVEEEASEEVSEDLDDEPPVEPPARKPKRSEQYDGQIAAALAALHSSLGRVPTNREIAARVDWGRDVRPQTQSERVRLALVRLGVPRNRKRGGVWVR
jgi:hypothetical protein